MDKIYDSQNKRELEMFFNFVSEKILQNELSLFLGAGSSIQYGAINWSQLIKKVCANCYKRNECNHWNDTDRAQCAELEGIDVKWNVCNILSDYDFEHNKTETYLNYLLDFDFKSIWTTNYDCIIEDVLKHKFKEVSSIYRYEHFRNLSYLGGLFLFKINGSISSPETIVITHEDFVDYKKSHEAYLILLKRELLCQNFLFLGCSFNDDILRMCIKDILNCIENSGENYVTKHYAVIAEKDIDKLNYMCKDLSTHYNINCLKVHRPEHAYQIALGIAKKVKLSSIFVSGAKRFERNSADESYGKQVCRDMVTAFLSVETMPYKFISGMGMSIGNFISGNVKNHCKKRDIKRYLEMEPFPFTSREANDRHRRCIMAKAGIFIFLYGDVDENLTNFEQGGMWKEYLISKSDEQNIIIPLPCGNNSVSQIIFERETKDTNSFSYKNKELLENFSVNKNNYEFFSKLVDRLSLATREKFDAIIDQIISQMA